MGGVSCNTMVGYFIYAMVDTWLILYLQCVRWTNSYRGSVNPIRWLWNASWGIWRAILTSSYALGKTIGLRIFYDANWAKNANNRRSTPEYVCLVGVGIILWNCNNNQPLHCLRVKYTLNNHCMKEIIWLGQSLGKCDILARETNICYIWQSRMYSVSHKLPPLSVMVRVGAHNSH